MRAFVAHASRTGASRSAARDISAASSLALALMMIIGAAVDVGHAFIVRRELFSVADDAEGEGCPRSNPAGSCRFVLRLGTPQRGPGAAAQRCG